ncbi:HAD-IA family hydrolase [Fibrobacter sp. UWB4]|uniref:HAD-IA family hydrolase n=1 Tax=Fibrobacter sp. UWB4 TaxID=1964356 RepID=UPI0015950982|nr:HAD-IA family hydrolase [Fibrobacter sp. UWB4]
MSQIRILFTSVGRRVELMQAFKKAATDLNADVVIYGADIVDNAPALFYCDKKIIVPRIKAPEYIPELLRICEQEKINALIPTIDTDLLLLAKNKAKFTAIGTEVLIAAEDKVQLCRDKRFTADYFIKCGLKSPKPIDDYTQYKGGFPAFIKPKDGSSSINAYKVHNAEELKSYASMIDDYIIQPFIEGTEFTIDAFCDFKGNPIFITPRERVAVRSGEVLKTRIAQDNVMIAECKHLLADYRPSGAITVQLIKQNSTGDNYYIEINPRFGGGAPLSIKAGADSAKACIELLMGKKVEYQPKAAKDNAVYSRFDQSICVSEDNAPVVVNSLNEVESRLAGIQAVIFDLDDTLYGEKEYIKSGFEAVAAKYPEIENLDEKLWNAFENGKPAFDEVFGDNDALKKECLAIYRNHAPNIHFYDSAESLIKKLRERNIKIGVITDGRPEGQRAKIAALGLENLVDEFIITDELGGAQFRKPCDIAFRIMQKRLNVPFEQMVYVGDNPKKDFIAPRELGMKSICFMNGDGLYSK